MENHIYSYAILGFGIAGQLLYMELRKRGVPASSILSIDSYWLGGDLVTEWSSVLANTPWWKPKKALEQYPYATEIIEEGNRRHFDHECFPVGLMASYVFRTAKQLLDPMHTVTCTIGRLNYSVDDSIWSLLSTDNRNFRAYTVFCTIGVVPKSLSLSKPVIPLSKALNKHELSNLLEYETPTVPKHVVIFGTNHSGTIALDNLNQLGIKTTALYRGEKPFSFECEGTYNGLKEQSEIIARKIECGDHRHIRLESMNNTLSVHSILHSATHIIYAIGFQQRALSVFVDGHETPISNYSDKTAAIEDAPRLYGFGAAFPAHTEVNGKLYEDISVLAFQEQIRKCIDPILASQPNP